ncbi:MAG: hypothetical protein ABSA42_09565 [Terracidiphilus sp.]|jgi:hypothetical protein
MFCTPESAFQRHLSTLVPCFVSGLGFSHAANPPPIFEGNQVRGEAAIKPIVERRISFQGEYLKLLKNHGVQFDERYIWQ